MKDSFVIFVNKENKSAKDLAEKMLNSKLKNGSVLFLTKDELNVLDSDDFRIKLFKTIYIILSYRINSILILKINHYLLILKDLMQII